MAYCSQIVGETLSVEKFDFLKSVIYSKIIWIKCVHYRRCTVHLAEQYFPFSLIGCVL